MNSLSWQLHYDYVSGVTCVGSMTMCSGKHDSNLYCFVAPVVGLAGTSGRFSSGMGLAFALLLGERLGLGPSDELRDILQRSKVSQMRRQMV